MFFDNPMFRVVESPKQKPVDLPTTEAGANAYLAAKGTATCPVCGDHMPCVTDDDHQTMLAHTMKDDRHRKHMLGARLDLALDSMSPILRRV